MPAKVHHTSDYKTLTVDGVEYVSTRALANAIGCSTKTILRAEKEGRIAKPERTVPTRGLRFGGATRFYSPAEVATAVAVLKPHGDQ
jgi:hypothetical protein